MRTATLLALALALATPQADAAKRNKAAVREFRAKDYCPSTGQFTGPCPGYVIDHIQPLCAGGKDEVANLQWQHELDAKEKDAAERRLCAKLRAGRSIPSNSTELD